MAKIVVVGSGNTDMVVKSPRIPLPGETVLGGQFVMVAGGKGANQAVAAARLGAEVSFVACVGDDLFGASALEGYQREGMDTRFVTRDPDAPSGVALIVVDEKGENSIVVAPGANHRLTPQRVRDATEAIRSADILVAQLEVPIESVLEAARIAHDAGVKVILNPAPACLLPEELLKLTDILTPNQTESQLLAGGEAPADELARLLLGKGPSVVALTLGRSGVLLADSSGWRTIPARTVTPVDTTAAGDAFNGAFAVALAEEIALEDAVRFAQAAAALSVTRMGAQPSLPTREETEAFLAS